MAFGLFKRELTIEIIEGKNNKQEFLDFIDKIPPNKINDAVKVSGYAHYTPLYLAASYGREDAVKLLLKRNADINKQDRICRFTALREAVDKGHANIVKELLANEKINATQPDNNGQIPFHLATENFLVNPPHLEAKNCLIKSRENIHPHLPVQEAILTEFKNAHKKGVDIGFNIPKTTNGLNKGKCTVMIDALAGINRGADGSEYAKAHQALADILSEFQENICIPREYTDQVEKFGTKTISPISQSENPSETIQSGKAIIPYRQKQ